MDFEPRKIVKDQRKLFFSHPKITSSYKLTKILICNLSYVNVISNMS